MTTFPRISTLTLTQQAADETANVYDLGAFPTSPVLLAEDDADDDEDEDDEDDEDEDDDDEDDDDEDDDDDDDGDEEDEA